MTPELASLRARQQALAAAIVGADAVPAGLLRPSARGSPARIDAYRHAHAARLAAALRDNFDMLARALGDEAFDTLAQAYLRAHPPTQPSIRWFGHALADFMDSAEAPAGHPALADLARMDWALRTAFDAADGPSIAAADLAGLPAGQWPGLRFDFHPSVALLPLQWAVEPAWHALRTHEGGGEPELPEPVERPHTLLVWRRGLGTLWRSLDDVEAALLRAAMAGRPCGELGGLAAGLLGDAEAAVPRLAALLGQWLVDGLVGRVQ